MNDILDEIEKPNTNKIFSILSFVFSIITTIILVYVLFLMPSTIKIKEVSRIYLLGNIAKGSCLFGVIFMILSFAKKETPNKFKLTGTILNAITFIIIVTSLIFAYIMDPNSKY